MAKVIKTFFEDAVVKTHGEEGSADCIYANSDATIPLCIGYEHGEENALLDYVKNLSK